MGEYLITLYKIPIKEELMIYSIENTIDRDSVVSIPTIQVQS